MERRKAPAGAGGFHQTEFPPVPYSRVDQRRGVEERQSPTAPHFRQTRLYGLTRLQSCEQFSRISAVLFTSSSYVSPLDIVALILLSVDGATGILAVAACFSSGTLSVLTTLKYLGVVGESAHVRVPAVPVRRL